MAYFHFLGLEDVERHLPMVEMAWMASANTPQKCLPLLIAVTQHLFGLIYLGYQGSENTALINKQYLSLPALFGGRVRPWDFLSKEDTLKPTSWEVSPEAWLRGVSENPGANHPKGPFPYPVLCFLQVFSYPLGQPSLSSAPHPPARPC